MCKYFLIFFKIYGFIILGVSLYFEFCENFYLVMERVVEFIVYNFEYYFLGYVCCIMYFFLSDC